MTETQMTTDPGVVAWVGKRAPFGLFTTDNILAVTGWNSWLENHSGRTRKEVIGKNLLDLYPEIVDRKMDRYFDEALEGLNAVLSQVFHGYLLPMRTETHATLVVNMPQSALISPLMINDRISGTIGYIEDVSERIKREKELLDRLAERERLIEELKAAAAEIKTLSNFLPICANCKKIRDDKGYWDQIESYISKHAGVSFSHGICPECAKKLYPEFYEDDGVTLKKG
jgi:hypothetical protein